MTKIRSYMILGIFAAAVCVAVFVRCAVPTEEDDNLRWESGIDIPINFSDVIKLNPEDFLPPDVKNIRENIEAFERQFCDVGSPYNLQYQLVMSLLPAMRLMYAYRDEICKFPPELRDFLPPPYSQFNECWYDKYGDKTLHEAVHHEIKEQLRYTLDMRLVELIVEENFDPCSGFPLDKFLEPEDLIEDIPLGGLQEIKVFKEMNISKMFGRPELDYEIRMTTNIPTPITIYSLLFQLSEKERFYNYGKRELLEYIVGDSSRAHMESLAGRYRINMSWDKSEYPPTPGATLMAGDTIIVGNSAVDDPRMNRALRDVLFDPDKGEFAWRWLIKFELTPENNDVIKLLDMLEKLKEIEITIEARFSLAGENSMKGLLNWDMNF